MPFICLSTVARSASVGPRPPSAAHASTGPRIGVGGGDGGAGRRWFAVHRFYLAAYPVLTLDDRRRFAFGAGDSKHRTRAEIDAAFRRLPGLVVVSEAASNDRTGEVGWIVIPKAAAAVAAPKSGGRPEPEHANRGK